MARSVTNFYSYVLNRAVDISVVVPSVTCPESLGLTGETPLAPVAGALPGALPAARLLATTTRSGWATPTSRCTPRSVRIAVVTMSAENKGYAKVGGDDFKALRRRRAARVRDQLLPRFRQARGNLHRRPLDGRLLGRCITALAHPERYRAIGSFSGGIGINPETLANNVHIGDQGAPPLPEEYDLGSARQEGCRGGL